MLDCVLKKKAEQPKDERNMNIDLRFQKISKYKNVVASILRFPEYIDAYTTHAL